MGVAARLALSLTIQPEFIVYSLAKAAGETIEPDHTGEPNVFSANRFWHQYTDSPISPFSFFPLRGTADNLSARFNLHLSYDEGLDYETDAYYLSAAPVWLIVGRATASNIAILRTVAEVWGGQLTFRDSDDQFVMIEGRAQRERPEGTPDQRWNFISSLAYDTPRAVVTEADIAQAAYSY